jgi:hypothetical protein
VTAGPLNVDPSGAVNLSVTVSPEIADPEAGLTIPETVMLCPLATVVGVTEQLVVDVIFVTWKLTDEVVDAPCVESPKYCAATVQVPIASGVVVA